MKTLIRKWNNLSLGLRASIVYTLCSLLTRGLGIITLPIFSNVLSLSEMGLCTNYNSWNSILICIATLSLCSASFNIGLLDYKDDRESFTLSILTLSNLATIVLLVIYVSFLGTFNKLLSLNTPLMIVMFASFLFTPAFDLWLVRQRYEYKYKNAAIATILYSVVTVIISVLSVLLFRNTGKNLGEVRLVSTNLVHAMFGVIFVIVIILKAKGKIKFSYWKYILPITLPLIAHSLSKQILDASDKLMINKMISEEAAGIYGTLHQISSLSLILWSAINASLIPYMYSVLQDKKTAKIKLNNLIILLMIVFSVFAIAMTLVAPEIVLVLTNENYYEAVYIIPPIATGVFLTTLYTIYGNVISFTKKNYLIMISTMVAAIVNVGMNYVLIPKFGYIAAAYTTLVSFIVLSLMQALMAKLVYKESIVDNKLLFLLSCCTVGISLLCNFLYPYRIIRYIVIALILIVAILLRKKIFNLFKQMKKR